MSSVRALSPDVLLPTNNPEARFIRSSAASAFYLGLNNSAARKNATNLKIMGQDHIIDFVESDVFDVGVDFAKKIVNDPNLPKVLCSVAVDFYSGKIAGSIVMSLIDLAYQSRGSMTMTTWLVLSSKLSPEYGVAGAYYVARTTNFLTNTTTGKIVEKLAGHVVSPGDFVCDLLIGGPRVPDRVVTELYKPQIMQTISQPPMQWDRAAVRYSALLDGIAKIDLTPDELSVYNKIQESAAERSTFVREVIENRTVETNYQEKLNEQAAREYTQAEGAIGVRQAESRAANANKAQVPLQQGREEAQKQAQIKAQQDAAAKQQQQQQLESTPPPGGTNTSNGNGQTGNSQGSSTSNNTQAPNTLKTTVPPSEEKPK